MDYSGLKPGVHFYIGDKHVKSLSLMDAAGWDLLGDDGRSPSADRLFATVSWKHIALTHRRNMVNEIDVDWQRGDEPVAKLPFRFDTMRAMARIDQAQELTGAAYLFKLRAGARLIGLRWLDPSAVTPDALSLTSDGYMRYQYSTNLGIRYLAAEDVIRFYNAGQREHDPEPSASSASSLAAQLLLGMEQTADTFYDTNGLPVVAVIVPDATNQEEVERTQNRFRRIFQQKRDLKGNKTIGLRAGTEIKTISFAPKDLAMSELEDSKIDAILLSHGVPPALTRRDINRAEAELKLQQFVGTVGGRLNTIAKTLNEDDDVSKFGIELVVHVERHPAMQKAELEKAQAVQELTGKPILTVNEARERIGLEPVEGGDEISTPQPSPFQMPPMPDNEKATEIKKLRTFCKAGKHEKRDFHSDILTPHEITAIMLEEGAISADAPFWKGYP